MFRARVAVCFWLLSAATAWSAEPTALTALAKLPVTEITVFKDGHAYVLHQGVQPVDEQGDVKLDALPSPVIGTFWPYSADKAATLASVTAGRRTVKVEKTALTIRELLEANVGGEAIISENNHNYPANIVGFLSRSVAELEATSVPGAGELQAQLSNLVLLKSAEGVRAVPFERIQDVRFVGPYETKFMVEEQRNLLTLHLDWKGERAKSANVGMAYVQKGIRWIPHYRVEIDGQGAASLKLQATLLNELTDLKNVTVNLVVGVPAFEFKGTTDPIALNQALTQLSPYFDQDSQTTLSLSNSIMTQQVARMNEVRQPVRAAPAAVDLGPDVAQGTRHEDLFVFTVKNVTLKKGERLVLPVLQQSLPYRDVFVIDVPFAPPAFLRGNVNAAQQQQLARMLNTVKAAHHIRLQNTSGQPLTTAPALIVQGNRVLAQGLMTYTSPGASSDLTVNTAVDVKVHKSETETRRTPNATEWRGGALSRIDLQGELSVTNLREAPIDVEVVRQLLGRAEKADHDGKVEMVNALEEADVVRPDWWSWYSWPEWWHYHNGLGRISWSAKIEPGKSLDLKYTWYYFSP